MNEDGRSNEALQRRLLWRRGDVWMILPDGSWSGPPVPPSGFRPAAHAHATARIDRALAAQTAFADIVAYRALAAGAPGVAGAVLLDRAYLHAVLDRGAAVALVPQGGCLVRLRIPSGTGVLPVGAIDPTRALPSEIVLARDTHLLLRGGLAIEGGVRSITLDVVAASSLPASVRTGTNLP